jgi:aminoglycoside phosphotransferase (APT) family kinase protein|tara:strand:- start:15646 stop:16638 length:993 start_codon:yes stop_codon:yes gene_type:complete
MSNDTVFGADWLELRLEEILGITEVSKLIRLSGGANRETWSFEASTKEKCQSLIMQIDRDGMDRLNGTCERESRILQIAKLNGVPVPTVVTSGFSGAPGSRSFSITEKMQGETIARKILRDTQWQKAREGLIHDMAKALAAIHKIDKRRFVGIELSDIRDPLLSLTSIYEALNDPHPTFDFAFRWLRANQPEISESTFVHGDFRLGNLLIDSSGLNAVLDWEIAQFGDPIQDLGWMCVRAWRFGNDQRVAGIGSYHELIDSYGQESGRNVSTTTLLWWEIFGTLRWGIICLQMGGDFRKGRTNSLEIAAIGRRVAENEYDLLQAIREVIK